MLIDRENSLRTITLSDGKQITVVAGRGKLVAVEMSSVEIETVRKMSPLAGEKARERIANEAWEKTKGRIGYCTRQKRDVEVLECVRCAGTRRGMQSIAAWEMCVRQSIMREGGK